MTEEIKEILKYIDQFVYVDQTYNDIKLSKIDTKLILDYITNLQQENDYYFKKNNEISNLNTSLRSARDDYKSRCEKAIEYIMSELITEWDIKNDGCVSGSDLPADAITPILNILNGVDENG